MRITGVNKDVHIVGSGCFINENEILTACHVAAVSEIEIRDKEGKSYTLDKISAYPDDLAILRVKEKTLHSAEVEENYGPGFKIGSALGTAFTKGSVTISEPNDMHHVNLQVHGGPSYTDIELIIDALGYVNNPKEITDEYIKNLKACSRMYSDDENKKQHTPDIIGQMMTRDIKSNRSKIAEIMEQIAIEKIDRLGIKSSFAMLTVEELKVKRDSSKVSFEIEAEKLLDYKPEKCCGILAASSNYVQQATVVAGTAALTVVKNVSEQGLSSLSTDAANAAIVLLDGCKNLRDEGKTCSPMGFEHPEQELKELEYEFPLDAYQVCEKEYVEADLPKIEQKDTSEVDHDHFLRMFGFAVGTAEEDLTVAQTNKTIAETNEIAVNRVPENTDESVKNLINGKYSNLNVQFDGAGSDHASCRAAATTMRARIEKRCPLLDTIEISGRMSGHYITTRSMHDARDYGRTWESCQFLRQIKSKELCKFDSSLRQEK